MCANGCCRSGGAILAFLHHLRLWPTNDHAVKAELTRLRQGEAEIKGWIEVLLTEGGKSFEKQVNYIYKLMYSKSQADSETLAKLRYGYNTQPNWVVHY